jgi:hypothetical protein
MKLVNNKARRNFNVKDIACDSVELSRYSNGIRTGARGLSLLYSVQTVSVANPASYRMATGDIAAEA